MECRLTGSLETMWLRSVGGPTVSDGPPKKRGTAGWWPTVLEWWISTVAKLLRLNAQQARTFLKSFSLRRLHKVGIEFLPVEDVAPQRVVVVVLVDQVENMHELS